MIEYANKRYKICQSDICKIRRISIEDYNDIKVGDTIESFEIQEIKRKL